MLHIGDKTIRHIHLGNETDVKFIRRGTDVVFENKLIEGVDFVRADWLGTGSGSPHLTLQHVYNTDEYAFIETTYKCQYRNNNIDMIIGFVTYGSNVGFRVFNAGSVNTFIDVHRRVNGTHSAKRITVGNGQIGVPRYLYASLTEYQVDNQRGSITLDQDFDGSFNFASSIFYTNDNSNDVWYKETKLRANNITYDLIPCILLQPIPASLDGNNTARPAFTCGMYDIISAKFFGHVGSGTFTVKGCDLSGIVYEVYDWLVGDGKAYIDTLHTLSASDIITTQIECLDIPQTFYIIYGNDSGSFTTVACILFSNSYLAFRPTGASTSFQVVCNTNTIYEISQGTTEIKVNGSIVWQGQDVSSPLSISCCLFAAGTNKVNCFNGKIGYFNISDNLHLIPCRLLRSIPASLDGNGIARSAGECGMWDTINLQFFGNVASSGSFSVANDD